MFASSSPPKGVEEYFNFYYALQQSAIFYTRLAFQQMTIGYQFPRTLPSSTVTRSANGTFNNVERKISSHKKLGRGGHMKKMEASSSHLVPPVICVENYLVENNSKNEFNIARRSARKVNFAHPLSTVKIKSPTPLYSSGDIGPFPGWNQNVEDQDYISYSCSDENNIESDDFHNGGSFGDIVGSGTDQVNYDGEGAPLEKRKKKKRRKNKKRRDSVEQDESDFASSYFSNLSSVSTDDPFAVYEVPLDDKDYEFISDVRLCGGKNSSTDENSGDDGGVNVNGWGLSEEGVLEMQELYGESGAARILKMEEAVERNFVSELNKVVKKA